MTSLIDAQGVTRRFGGLTAVNAVDFRVERGEIVGLIGPNGAGKTTFFHVISGFLAPDAGRISFKGESILGLKPHRISRLGMSRTFQIVKPFPEMTVLDNATRQRSPAGAHRRPVRHRKRRAYPSHLDRDSRDCREAGRSLHF
jgi:ABC-type branched-subunit amino acid transport system ATPase component